MFGPCRRRSSETTLVVPERRAQTYPSREGNIYIRICASASLRQAGLGVGPKSPRPEGAQSMAKRVYDRPGKPLPEKRAINIRIMPKLFGELCRAAEEAGRPV